MESSDKHQKLRQLLIDKITNSNLALKPSKSSLTKKTDENLVNLLFINTVEAEKQLWHQDIIKKIIEFEPGSESKYKNAGTNLLTHLIKVVQKNTKNL